MKLGKYIDMLKALEKEYGRDIELIYSKDDEGNYFDFVVFGAEAVYYDSELHRIKEPDENHQTNVICLN